MNSGVLYLTFELFKQPNSGFQNIFLYIFNCHIQISFIKYFFWPCKVLFFISFNSSFDELPLAVLWRIVIEAAAGAGYTFGIWFHVLVLLLIYMSERKGSFCSCALFNKVF